MTFCYHSAPGHPSPRLVPSDHGTGEEDMDEQALQERRDAAFAMMLQDCEGPLPHHVSVGDLRDGVGDLRDGVGT